jgi:hypothetical protein
MSHPSRLRGAQKADRGKTDRVGRRSKGARVESSWRGVVNQENQIKLARHSRELPADGLRAEKQSQVHDENLNMHSSVSCLKPEVFSLQKTEVLYFAPTVFFCALS